MTASAGYPTSEDDHKRHKQHKEHHHRRGGDHSEDRQRGDKKNSKKRHDTFQRREGISSMANDMIKQHINTLRKQGEIDAALLTKGTDEDEFIDKGEHRIKELVSFGKRDRH